MERSADMVLLLHGCDQEHSDDAAHELVFSRVPGPAAVLLCSPTAAAIALSCSLLL